VSRKRALLAWSTGKDSAWTLHVLRGRPEIEIAGLFTTVHEQAAEVAVHAVPLELLEAQARATGLPLHRVPIPHPCPNAAYEAAIAAFVAQAKRDGVTHLAFGDLFLEDIRRYREGQLAASGVEPLFPLWGRDTRALASEMTAAGLRAWIVCVDSKQAPREWAGRVFDSEFVAAIPEGIDPCGERGEFHTFAFEGPMFSQPVRASAGGIVERDGFVFAGLRPA
jgi:uncharacterized protein (TIGR00290 family)